MRKFTIFTCLLICVLFANAQKGKEPIPQAPYIVDLTCKGDTIWIENKYGAGFGYSTIDVDKGYPCLEREYFTKTAIGAFSKPIGAKDTFYCKAATSCLMGGGANGADDWLVLGPWTMPATGASITWFQSNTPKFQEGFELKMNTTGATENDFTDANFHYEQQKMYPNGPDSVWTIKKAVVPPKYNNQKVWLALHHFGAQKGALMYIKRFVVWEGINWGPIDNTGIIASVNEKNDNLNVTSVYPNPANDKVTINYELTSGKNVEISIYDMSGRVIYNNVEVNQYAGMHFINIDLSKYDNGIYYYAIKVDNRTAKGKISVAR